MAQKTQKAVVFNNTGDSSVLNIGEWPFPERKEGEVLVKIAATSVNPVDYKVRNGGAYAPVGPKVPGGDLAGTVEEADANSKFKKGDRVFALTNTFLGSQSNGTYAEYFSLPEDWLASIPEKTSFEEAAGAPLVSLTATQALDTAKNLVAGGKVLITAGAGGVGHVAIQIAKSRGLFVVATAGSKNQDFVKELGADEVVDYTKEKVWEKYPKGSFDAVVDLVGGDDEPHLYALIKPGGTFAHIFNTGTSRVRIEEGQKWTDKSYTTTLVQPNGKQLSHVADLIQQGKFKLVIDKVFPLEQVREAHDAVEAGHTRGKVILTI